MEGVGAGVEMQGDGGWPTLKTFHRLSPSTCTMCMLTKWAGSDSWTALQLKQPAARLGRTCDSARLRWALIG